MRYRFRDFELDEALYELRREGRAIDLQPKALNLLLYLLQNRERTPTKDELLDALWPGVSVGEASLTRAVRAVRRALHEHAEDGGILRTVRGRGYGIGVPVEVVLDEAAAAVSPVAIPVHGQVVVPLQELLPMFTPPVTAPASLPVIVFSR